MSDRTAPKIAMTQSGFALTAGMAILDCCACNALVVTDSSEFTCPRCQEPQFACDLCQLNLTLDCPGTHGCDGTWFSQS